MPELQLPTTLFRKKYNDKIRLSFPTLEIECPELAGRIKILRFRILELEQNFFRDSRWALGWFNGVAILMLVFPMAATVLTAFYAVENKSHVSAGWPFAIALTALGTMIAAGGHAFGWHKRYRALLSAKWKMTALRTNMDQFLAATVLDHAIKGDFSEADRKTLTDEVQEWGSKFEEILTSFGDQYGSAVSMPNSNKQ